MVRFKFALALLTAMSLSASAVLMATDAVLLPMPVETTDETPTDELAAAAKSEDSTELDDVSLEDSESDAASTASDVQDDQEGADFSALFLGSDDEGEELVAQEAAVQEADKDKEKGLEVKPTNPSPGDRPSKVESAALRRELMASVRELDLVVTKHEAEGLELTAPTTAVAESQILTWRTAYSLPYQHAFYHHPLYFEDANLERCGHEAGCLQSVYSGLHFYGSTAVLPAKMLWTSPHCPVYSLGPCRCGDQFSASEIFWKR